MEIVVGDRIVDLPPKIRSLLAALLLRTNHTASYAELSDILWDGECPPDARSTVQKYVMRARNLLSVAGVEELIHTDPGGYRITADAGQLDLDRFRELTSQAAAVGMASDDAQEAALLADALALWRAVPPLSNVASAALQRQEVPELMERYLQVLDRRITLDLGLGRHAELVPELATLVRRHPQWERLWAHYMRALHRSSRQGDALAAYREVVRYLADELGIDPGPELRATHQEVLGGHAVDTPPPDGRAPSPLHPPQQLPRAAVGFVGRTTELSDAVEALDHAPVLITGMPGVGKTALAVIAAHRVARKYPDGQLFAELGGCSADRPGDVQVVLSRFLRALGVAAEAVPDTVQEQVLLYRSLLADRQVLVVLDDVSCATQVRTLLPGSARCGVLVTSRDELAGLAVSPGIHRIRLAGLEREHARRMLAALVGPERVAAENRAAEELLEVCGGLALAIRVATAQLTRSPEPSVAAYVARLRAAGPMSVLRIDGDADADLAVAFSRSFRLLEPNPKRMLRLLGHAPAGKVTACGVTASEVAHMAGMAVEHAAAVLEDLASRSLLDRLPAARYRMHTLIHCFAAAIPRS